MSEKVKNKDADPAPPPATYDLDTALEDTFPASDPPTTTQPGRNTDDPAHDTVSGSGKSGT